MLHRFSVGLAFSDYSCDKIVIGEPPNLIQNVAPKRAEIGQLTVHIGSCTNRNPGYEQQAGLGASLGSCCSLRMFRNYTRSSIG